LPLETETPYYQKKNKKVFLALPPSQALASLHARAIWFSLCFSQKIIYLFFFIFFKKILPSSFVGVFSEITSFSRENNISFSH
jgi:hypothetical protein